MKFREAVLFSGERFRVPQCIQRIDTRSTHGWQVRYHGTRMFSDHSQDGSGARAALDRAIEELKSRIACHPAPTTLQSKPSQGKTTDLPSGISGPVFRLRAKSQVRVAEFSLCLPRFGRPPHRRTVHIGPADTYTAQRFGEMLAKCIALRQQAEAEYLRCATAERRKSAAALDSPPARSPEGDAAQAQPDKRMNCKVLETA